jgi:hypothetical protein
VSQVRATFRAPWMARLACIAGLAFPFVSGAQGAGPELCLPPLGVPWWSLSATRFVQLVGTPEKAASVAIERHWADRRVMVREGGTLRLDVERYLFALRDSVARIAMTFGADGRIVSVRGDTALAGKDLAPLLNAPCTALSSNARIPDKYAREDSVRAPGRRGRTRIIPAGPVTVGGTVDTLGGRLRELVMQRSVADTGRGTALTRSAPNQAAPDTAVVWYELTGTERERWLLREGTGMVVFREKRRQLLGRGTQPPFATRDTVPIRATSDGVDRVVDSATVQRLRTFPRRGVLSVSGMRDTIAVHYREQRGDTLVTRQIRKSGWRNELRSTWRAGVLVSAELVDPGTAVLPPGVTRRTFSVQRDGLHDSGARDRVAALPAHAWSLVSDGFEEHLIPALLTIPADSQPHRFSIYGIAPTGGAWLDWSVTVRQRGGARLVQFRNLQGRSLGTMLVTPTGDLLALNIGGGGGVSRIPGATTAQAAQLEQLLRGTFTRSELLGEMPAPPSAPPH